MQELSQKGPSSRGGGGGERDGVDGLETDPLVVGGGEGVDVFALVGSEQVGDDCGGEGVVAVLGFEVFCGGGGGVGGRSVAVDEAVEAFGVEGEFLDGGAPGAVVVIV